MPSRTRSDQVAGKPESSAEAGRGLRKAAIFLVMLDEYVAADVFRRLDDGKAKLISREIVRLGPVDGTEVEEVLAEFREHVRAAAVHRAVEKALLEGLETGPGGRQSETSSTLKEN